MTQTPKSKAIPEVEALQNAPVGTLATSIHPGAEPLERVRPGAFGWRGIDSRGRASAVGAYYLGYRTREFAPIRTAA